MASKFSDEFYEHLHSIEERYSYLNNEDTLGSTWPQVISDDDADLVFCQEYIKKHFAVESEKLKRFKRIFYEVVPYRITSISELGQMAGCSASQVSKYLDKSDLSERYHLYQRFLRSTVVYDLENGRRYMASTMKDVLRLCGFPTSKRYAISRSKDQGNVIGKYRFRRTVDYLSSHKEIKVNAEELYEQNIVRIA